MSDIERAAEMIFSARKGVAFTGAGVSAASGISTYRDTGGLWDRYGSQGMLNVLAKHPDKAHEILGGFFSALEAARPNPAHLALAQLEEMGHLVAVITQNVDNMHREAGNETVFELHGNLFRLRCMSCETKQVQRISNGQLIQMRLLTGCGSPATVVPPGLDWPLKL